MKRLGILALVLLTGCSGPSTAQPTNSPTASTTAIAVSTTCPDSGKARAAVMASATLGNHPTVVYMDQPSANGGPVPSSLIRYDVTTASKTEIVKSIINEAEVSPGGDWIAISSVVAGQPLLQVVRTDGQYLQTLYCGESSWSLGGILWSRDGKSLLFESTGTSGPPPFFRLDLDKGTLQTLLRNNQLSADYAPLSWLDGNRLLVGGRPVGIGPGFEIRILDLSRGPNQQASDLPSVMSSTVECFDVDAGATALYTSECNGAFSDQGGGTLRGPSTIRAQSPTGGGQKRVVLTSASLAVTQIRVVSPNLLLLSVANQDPANSSAAGMNGLWKVNTDGSGLSRLVGSAGKQGQFAAFSHAVWANVSRDASLYAFQISALGKPPSYSLVVGPLAGGQATTVASRTDGGLLLLVGWTTS